MINSKRIRRLNHKDPTDGAVLYWMDRDRRVHDNWAMLHAQALAKDKKLAVLYVIPSTFLDGTFRQQYFMIEGLKETAENCKKLGIAFFALPGEPDKVINKFVQDFEIGHVVTDFSPLKLPRSWRESLKKSLPVAFDEVDAHNIVPVWEASPKLEYAAYTIRPKIHKKLDEFFDEFPKIKKQKQTWQVDTPDWEAIYNSLEVEKSDPLTWIKPGAKAAQKLLKDFVENKLKDYDDKRNDPNEDAISNLSPYLHYGQLSAQRAAQLGIASESFFEELVVRRELSDNFCYYNPHYDKFEGFHEWAQKTLNEHRDDPREYIYSSKQFEEAKTHDPLWNAAQTEMVERGKMHGYMRMYWAKKILEWTPSPEEALEIANYLNNKYELDGRDPNGYVGTAWSIGGVHDRAWTERDVYGKIRYMNFNGCKRKFDVQLYIDKWIGQQELI